jgi:ankyrin repeat protein
MPTRELPARPNLEHLKNQAATLLHEAQSSQPEALARLSAQSVTAPPKLADALHTIAREYGFDTWPALKLHVELATSDPFEALSAAIKAEDLAAVRDLLTRNPSLKSRIDDPLPNYSFDTPALLAAVQRNNRALADALLDFGANPNARSRWWAGSFGVLDHANIALSDHLISRGAYLDIHSAVRLGRIDRVRELLTQDPQLVHARGGDGQLPLHFASTVEIAALLLDHGAEIDARDIDHESTAAQYMACTRQNLEGQPEYRHDVARFLLSRGAKADILLASAVGDLARVERIVNDDPETLRITVTTRYFPKGNPLSGGSIYIFGFGWTKTSHMLAHQFGHPEVYSFLMQRSPIALRLINAAEVADDEAFARILAAQPHAIQKLRADSAKRIIGVATRNNTHALHLLVTAGWPTNPAMENGQTALHFAAFHGNLAMVQDLIAHNAPINVFEQEHGGNPLGWALYGSLHGWYAGQGDYPGVVRALLAAGADVPKPELPLQGTPEVLEVIRQHTP